MQAETTPADLPDDLQPVLSVRDLRAHFRTDEEFSEAMRLLGIRFEAIFDDAAMKEIAPDAVAQALGEIRVVRRC